MGESAFAVALIAEELLDTVGLLVIMAYFVVRRPEKSKKQPNRKECETHQPRGPPIV